MLRIVVWDKGTVARPSELCEKAKNPLENVCVYVHVMWWMIFLGTFERYRGEEF